MLIFDVVVLKDKLDYLDNIIKNAISLELSKSFNLSISDDDIDNVIEIVGNSIYTLINNHIEVLDNKTVDIKLLSNALDKYGDKYHIKFILVCGEFSIVKNYVAYTELVVKETEEVKEQDSPDTKEIRFAFGKFM